MKQLILTICAIGLFACSESPTYRVFTATSNGDYIETITMTTDLVMAESIFTMKSNERDDCNENCDMLFQQLYIATEPCRNEYGLTICKEINYIKKW